MNSRRQQYLYGTSDCKPDRERERERESVCVCDVFVPISLVVQRLRCIGRRVRRTNKHTAMILIIEND